jgi:fumarate reductase subunit D
MKKLLLKLEPLIWLIFGQGILIGTILLTGWVFVVGIAMPLNIISPESLSYDRALMLASNIVGRFVLLGLIILPMWKGAHHMRHAFIDSGGGDRDAKVAPLLYLVASLGSAFAVYAVFRI